MLENNDSILEKRRKEHDPDATVPPGSSILKDRMSVLEGRARRNAETAPPPPILESDRRPILEGRRTRALREERLERDRFDREDRPVRRSVAGRLFWSIVLAAAIVVVAVVAYGLWAVAAYHGQMNLLPALQGRLVADGQRIHTAGQAMQNQKETWGQRFNTAMAALAGRVPPASEQAALQQQNAALQGQVENLQNAQQTSDQRIKELQGQVEQMKNQPAPAAPQRIDFQANLHESRELSPGVRLDVSRVDVLHHRFDGSVQLSDGRTLPIRGRGLSEPLKFLSAGSTAPNELVVTQITSHSVLGYLELAPKASDTSSVVVPGARVAGVSPSR